MILDIVLYGDPVLRQKCAPVEAVTAEVKKLSEDMIETMIDAEGVGLAAPQIGLAIQLAVVDITHAPDSISYVRKDGEDVELDTIMPLAFINPEIKRGREKERCEEGCLSIPDLRAEVIRPSDIEATLTLLDGSKIVIETDGLLARAILHETDHLNGVLFIDRLTSASKLKARRQLKQLQREWQR